MPSLSVLVLRVLGIDPTPPVCEIWTRPYGVCCVASRYLTQGVSDQNTKIALKVKGQSQISP